MPNRVLGPPPCPTPVAQYVRMSDEGQQYSIDNQKAAIREYAERNGFSVVKTYTDAGKSGVVLKHRTALRTLLQDVVSGAAKYKAILVYDVSRWGRFPNNDEAAHYEFLCTNSGVPLHYCAESFANDETPSSSLLKALKRSMAAEFSRELGDKVFRGKSRIVQLGFWVGGQPGYGYRRMMLSAAGKPKQRMKDGEHKSLTTDRVILVPGPGNEIACVRHIFSMAIARHGGTAIARDLNRRGILLHGRQWTYTDVFNVLKNPKYVGCNVWHRRTQRLRGKSRPVLANEWITKPGAFAPIVDRQTFDLARANIPKRADTLWTDKEMLNRLKRLLKAKGRLSETLILNARGMPSPNTLHNHFGSYRQMYSMVGYHLPAEDIFKTEQLERTMQLRRKIVNDIEELFPRLVTKSHLPLRSRSVLRLTDGTVVALLLCRSRRRPSGLLQWIVQPCVAEREFMTLMCRLNPHHDRVHSYYLFPNMNLKIHRLTNNDPRLTDAIPLKNLSEFLTAVDALRGRKRM